MTAILFILKRIGYFVVDHWKIVIPAVLAFIVFAWVLWSFACNRPGAKLNEAEIQKAEQAIKERNDKELREILAASDAREAVIDSNVANAERDKVNALHEARKKYEGMTPEELAAELERRR